MVVATFQKSKKYDTWVPAMEKALRKRGEPMTSRELREVVGVPPTQQANHAAILLVAADREDSQIATVGWRHVNHSVCRIWGLKEWNLPIEGEHLNNTKKRTESRKRNSELAKKREQQRQWRETRARNRNKAKAPDKEDRRDNGARTHRETSTMQIVLGESYLCTGVNLNPDGTISLTLTSQSGAQVRVIQQED